MAELDDLSKLDEVLSSLDRVSGGTSRSRAATMRGGSTKYRSLSEVGFTLPGEGVGVVVPIATDGGVPFGVNPHEVKGRTNVFDVVTKTTLEYDPGYISKEENNRIIEAVTAKLHAKGITNNEDICYYARRAIAEVAIQREREGQSPDKGYKPGVKNAAAQQDKRAENKTAMESQRKSLIGIFSSDTPAAAAVQQQRPQSQHTAKPSKHVLIDMNEFGTIDVECADVRIDEEKNTFTLCYSKSAGGTVWQPSKTYNKPFAAQVAGDNDVFLLLTTGITVDLDDLLLVVLLISKKKQQHD